MKSKTIIKTISLLGIFLIVGLILYTILNDNVTNDEKHFKTEYESLNGKKNKNNKMYVTVKVEKDNNIKYADFDKAIDFLNTGTGILYLGFPECPWCRNIVSPLIDVAKAEEIDDIYYFNALSIRDEKKLENGKIKTIKKGTKEYYKLVNKLKDHLPSYEGLEDESIKRIYFPTVVFVQSGKIVGTHTGTVDSQTDPYKTLSKKQTKELKKIYKSNINKIYGTCDESC